MGILVSIVIPTYNRGSKLRKTLESVLAQTHSDWEALVIDDGSTDDTPSLFTGEQDSRIRYIRRPNGGVAAARNTGLQASKGDFIAFLDSDDLWRPWKLELQVQALRQNPDVGLVWTDMEAIDAEGRVLHSTYLRKFYSSYRWFTNETLFAEHRPLTDPVNIGSAIPPVLHVGEIFSPMLTGSLVHTSTAMITRKRFETTGLFDESMKPIGEDYDFYVRTCREGPVGFLDVVSISYRIGASDQLTRPQNGATLAKNFVRTVTTALRDNASRVEERYRDLIEKALTEGHLWAAEDLLQLGCKAEARHHLRQALQRQLAIRPLTLLGMSLLPDGLFDSLRTTYRRMKKFRHVSSVAMSEKRQ